MDIMIIHIFIQGALAFVVLGVPFVYVLRTGKLLRGFLLSWGLMFLSIFILSTVIYDLVSKLISPEFAAKFLPEAKSVFAVILIGWIYSLIITSIAAYIRDLIKSRKAKNNSKENEGNC